MKTHQPLTLQHRTAALLKHIRDISLKHLPISHSFIPYDILIVLFYAHVDGRRLTIKELFNSLPYSDMGTRYHFRRLIEQNYIEVIRDHIDSRMKYCQVTKKFEERFELLTDELLNHKHDLVKRIFP